MDSSRIGGRSEADSSSQPPVASSPSALSSPASPIPPAARSPARAQLYPSLPERHRLRVVRGDDHGGAVQDPAELGHQPPRPGPVKSGRRLVQQPQPRNGTGQAPGHGQPPSLAQAERRLNSSHPSISYAVF